MGLKRSTIQELTSQIEAHKAEGLAAQKTIERLRRAEALTLEFLVADMAETIEMLPRTKRIDASLSDCKFNRLMARRHVPGIIRLAQLEDGAALLYTTKEFLMDCTHRLEIPHTGKPELFTQKVNVDCQMIPGPDLHLIGPEQFMGERIAINALYYGAGALAVEAEMGWMHVISSPSMLGFTSAPEQV